MTCNVLMGSLNPTHSLTDPLELDCIAFSVVERNNRPNSRVAIKAIPFVRNFKGAAWRYAPLQKHCYHYY